MKRKSLKNKKVSKGRDVFVKEKGAILAIVLILIAAIFVFQQRSISTAAENVSLITKLFENGTIAIIFFIIFMIAFRRTLRLNQPDVSTIGKISLMLVSAYFSYSFFTNFNTPYFIAMVGGMGTVIGIQQATIFGAEHIFKQQSVIRKKSRRQWMNLFIIFALLIAFVLDIGATFINLVHGEGQSITHQENFNKAMEMKESTERAGADKEKALALNRMSGEIQQMYSEGNYANARYHADRFEKMVGNMFGKNITQPKKQVETVIKGSLEKGFARLVGDDFAPKLNLWFMVVFSIGLTVAIIVMEAKEQLSPSRSAESKDNDNKMTATARTGKIGFRHTGSNVSLKRKPNEMENKFLQDYSASDKKRGAIKMIADENGVDPAYVSRTISRFKDKV